MNLSAKQIEFLKSAKSKDGDSPFSLVLLSEKYRSAISTDRTRIHAIKYTKAISVVGLFRGNEFVIKDEAKVYPSLTRPLDETKWEVAATAHIDCNLLIEAIAKADGIVKIQIVKGIGNDGKEIEAIRSFMYIEGVPAFSLVMGMFIPEQDIEDGEHTWMPEEVKA